MLFRNQQTQQEAHSINESWLQAVLLLFTHLCKWLRNWSSNLWPVYMHLKHWKM